MSEHAPDQKPDTHQEQESKPLLAPVISDVPEDWKKYQSTFYDMFSKLTPVKRNGVKGEDLHNFLKDLEKFDNYITNLMTEKGDYDHFISDIDAISKQVVKLIDAIVSASRVWNRFGESELSMKEIAENDDAYAERLSRCYVLVRVLLKEFFGEKH